MIRSLVVALVFIPCLAFADFTGRVVGVADGDTITVLHDGRGEKIRLHGIDCPEKRQAFGSKSKQFTSEHAFGKDVTVKVKDTDFTCPFETDAGERQDKGSKQLPPETFVRVCINL